MKRLVLPLVVLGACSSSSTTPATDAGSATTDGGVEASTDSGSTPPGETCTGFGTGDPCGANGNPTYGYVCVGGGPPGFTGCVKASDSSLGQTWCCPSNDCVAEPDQDAKCAATAATPHLLQCPTGATPPSDCVKTTVSGSPYDYACCP